MYKKNKLIKFFYNYFNIKKSLFRIQNINWKRLFKLHFLNVLNKFNY